jgi:hypothetical protein
MAATTTVTDAQILAAVEGPSWSLRPKPTSPLRSAIAREMAGEPVGDLLDLYRRLLANVLRDRDYSPPLIAVTVAACERAIRAEQNEEE